MSTEPFLIKQEGLSSEHIDRHKKGSHGKAGDVLMNSTGYQLKLCFMCCKFEQVEVFYLFIYLFALNLPHRWPINLFPTLEKKVQKLTLG